MVVANYIHRSFRVEASAPRSNRRPGSYLSTNGFTDTVIFRDPFALKYIGILYYIHVVSLGMSRSLVIMEGFRAMDLAYLDRMKCIHKNFFLYDKLSKWLTWF